VSLRRQAGPISLIVFDAQPLMMERAIGSSALRYFATANPQANNDTTPQFGARPLRLQLTTDH